MALNMFESGKNTIKDAKIIREKQLTLEFQA